MLLLRKEKENSKKIKIKLAFSLEMLYYLIVAAFKGSTPNENLNKVFVKKELTNGFDPWYTLKVVA